jgi:hypothetical protein
MNRSDTALNPPHEKILERRWFWLPYIEDIVNKHLLSLFRKIVFFFHIYIEKSDLGRLLVTMTPRIRD